MDDPCYKVLPAALRKYQITADWRGYALYIVYGDKERCLGLDEKPLVVFKELDRLGMMPMFMLRKFANAVVPVASEVSRSGTVSPARPGAIQVQFQNPSASIWTAKQAAILPGGVV